MKLSFKNFTAGSKAVCYEVKNNDNLVDSHKIALLTTFLLIINIFFRKFCRKKENRKWKHRASSYDIMLGW